MELLRTWCGQKQILGCGVPVMPAFGLVDYCRVSCDVGLDWDDVVYAPVPPGRCPQSRPQPLTLFRRQLNGRAYGSDPDVFFLQEENCKLTAEQKRTLATVNALLGNVFLTSDMPSHYGCANGQSTTVCAPSFEHATQVQAEAENDRLYIRYLLDGTPQKLCFRPVLTVRTNHNKTTPAHVLCFAHNTQAGVLLFFRYDPQFFKYRLGLRSVQRCHILRSRFCRNSSYAVRRSLRQTLQVSARSSCGIP